MRHLLLITLAILPITTTALGTDPHNKQTTTENATEICDTVLLDNILQLNKEDYILSGYSKKQNKSLVYYLNTTKNTGIDIVHIKKAVGKYTHICYPVDSLDELVTLGTKTESYAKYNQYIEEVKIISGVLNFTITGLPLFAPDTISITNDQNTKVFLGTFSKYKNMKQNTNTTAYYIRTENRIISYIEILY